MGDRAQAVLMEHVTSKEYFYQEGKEPEQVLKDISLIMKRGEIWGVKGTTLFEIKLLLEIIANIRPYDEGKCALIGRGMMRNKRFILEHLFYIWNSDMIYPNMNTLEFLMFATAKFKMDAVDRQDLLFQFLLNTGLGYLSLTPIRFLTKEEKAVITLLTGAYSKSQIIVFNLPEYDFTPSLTRALSQIAAFIKEQNKTLIIGTQDSFLIEEACDHLAVIGRGVILYQGRVDAFCQQYDKVEIIIDDDRLFPIKEKLSQLHPHLRMVIKDDRLLLINDGESGLDFKILLNQLIEAGLPKRIERNSKRVEYAYEELLRQHDL